MMHTYVFDLDGTIVLKGQPIDQAIADSLLALKASSRVIFASARPIRDMLPLLPVSLHDCLMIGCNGGMAWQNGEFIFSSRFEDHHARDLIDDLRSQSVPYVLDGRWNYAISETPHAFHQYMGTLSDQRVAEETILIEGVSKILILDGAARPRVDALFAQRGYCFNIHHHKSDNLFDITPQAENKYLALKKSGIDFSTTIAFGNDANDFAMLDYAQVAVFLGSQNDYPSATHYCSTSDLITLLPRLMAENG